jgi:Ras-related protein Rab-5C
VYDINSEASFNTLDFWYDSIRKATDEDIVIYLVGNKLDLVNVDSLNRRVSTQRGIEFAKKYNLAGFCECSAKDNINITDTFMHFYKGIVVLTCLDIYNKQKPKLEEKTKEKLKLLQTKKNEPRIKCC